MNSVALTRRQLEQSLKLFNLLGAINGVLTGSS